MQVASSYIRSLVRKLAASAADVAAFLASVQAASDLALDAINKGRVLMGTASGGTSVQYGLNSITEYKASDVLDACDRILLKADALIAETPAISLPALTIALTGFAWGSSTIRYAVTGGTS